MRREMRPVARLRWRDRGHGRRLHQLCRVRLRAFNTDRLQGVAFIERVGEISALGGRPFGRLISKFDSVGGGRDRRRLGRWEEQKSELQSLKRSSNAVFCW